MGLTAEEMAQLANLQEKAKIEHMPMTDKEIDEAEARAAKYYDGLELKFGKYLDAWNDFCSILSSLSGDNLRLIAEIRSLKKKANQ